MGWKARKAGERHDCADAIYSQINGGRDLLFQSTRPASRSHRASTRAHYTQGDFNWQTPPTTAERANAAKYKVASANTLFANYNGIGAAQIAIKNGSPLVPVDHCGC